ncbi:hypothetical protein LMG28688_06378 [Paraburkholderia caffeinitolerans]|uniref:D-inositol-3-phosphate glycosyltransferase n=2 Tax=Paraburkholderia caffeinitolerans TaxID=1723730 RepID=A0A6J5H044_9BURK|nr:glycosyltransferase [Paraburkholderia dokdonensis]CAB3806659.1 hypothetical protein LMG28688_06378 [Paraburkholderia caffeinitolerans]
MKLRNVVLSTEPRGGKGGVATVIPMYIEALDLLGRTEFISTHNGRDMWGKFAPWLCSFFRCAGMIFRESQSQLVFHLHPGSGFCIIRMLALAMFLRGLARQHVIVYLHTPYLESYLKRKTWRWIFRTLIGLSSQVIVLTSYARALLEKYDLASKANVVPNPYRVHAPYPERIGGINGEITVLTMGRLVEGKGIAETVRAMSCLPENFRLVVAGDGELVEGIKADIEKYGLSSRVALVGWVFGQDKINLLSGANVFCLPSKVDSFGMSFVEAQCYDLPIVAFRHLPVMEVIRPGGAIYVDELGEKKLALAIEEASRLNSKIVWGSGAIWIDDSFGIRNISVRLKRVIDAVVMEAR